MAWSNSRVFRQYLADRLGAAATTHDLDTGTYKAALYNNTITPDPNVAATVSAYNTGVWAVAGEVIDSTGGSDWPAGGPSLAGLSLNIGTAGVVFWDATDLASGATADLANATGCLVYSTVGTPVANQGICYNYFGAPNTVANGTFTIIWNVNGILRLTLV